MSYICIKTFFVVRFFMLFFVISVAIVSPRENETKTRIAYKWTVLYKREPTALEILKIFQQLVPKIFEDGII